MGVGRFLFVALPFAMTLASLICIIVASLAGVTDKGLYMFDVDTKNLSISTSSITDLARRSDHYSTLSGLTTAALAPNPSDNITAAQLGLADYYKVSLWTYCTETSSNETCIKPAFNWAASAVNTSSLGSLVSTTGVNVTLPKDITSSLKTFVTISKWTQVVYIIAFVSAAVELVFGLFAICSRAGSCLTWIVSGVSTASIIIASIMATAQSAIVVGAIKATTEAYGVKASLDTSFLSITWLAVAFSIGASIFWMFSICCCKADHNSRRSNRGNRNSDAEKLVPAGAYQRVSDPYVHGGSGAGYGGQEQGVIYPQGQQEYGVPSNAKPTRGNGAYEPYSHTAI